MNEINTKRFPVWFSKLAILVASIPFVFFSIVSVMSHGGYQQSALANSILHVHEQPVAPISNNKKDKKNEMEPRPPVAYTSNLPKLNMYYLAPVFYAVCAAVIYKRFLLTTQMRF